MDFAFFLYIPGGLRWLGALSLLNVFGGRASFNRLGLFDLFEYKSVMYLFVLTVEPVHSHHLWAVLRLSVVMLSVVCLSE